MRSSVHRGKTRLPPPVSWFLGTILACRLWDGPHRSSLEAACTTPNQYLCEVERRPGACHQGQTNKAWNHSRSLIAVGVPRPRRTESRLVTLRLCLATGTRGVSH